ncbi:helix-turn-helix domain-containing protein [Allorhizobium undicola]|uniref:helix-turn-helix domain-containing protein n=1 Tax=Allorhizobium undicola TaxID=78527 RepID=UPI000ADC7756|nr:AraC family transcriptional regulator [Allorhizobium undicola]
MKTPTGLALSLDPALNQFKLRTDCTVCTVTLQNKRKLTPAFSEAQHGFQELPGSIGLQLATADSAINICNQGSKVVVLFRPRKLEELAQQTEQKTSKLLCPPVTRMIDRRAQWIALGIREELESISPSLLAVDASLTILALHVVRTYSGPSCTFAAGRARLSKRTIQHLQDFLLEHLDENVSLERLAREADMSVSHFLRAFSSSFGQTPHQYVIELRLKKAEQLLTTTSIPIGEIAYLTGFASQSHLTTTMKRRMSVTPREMRG